MSIPVTCPECESHFHVGDEFAGQPGRCPECAAILQVPDPAATSTNQTDPHPYWTPHEAAAFESQSAPSPPQRRDDRPERQPVPADYSNGPRARQFDPHARAARWEVVSRGLRNLMVAVVLIAVDVLVISAFIFMDGVNLGPQVNGAGLVITLVIGTAVASAIGTFLWAAGRIGCSRVPYIPARQAAVPAGVVAGLTAMTGVLGFGLIAGGMLIVQQGNVGGAGLPGLGICALLPASVGFAIAELLGLLSQVRMADGLRDPGFARSSRTLLVVFTLLIMLSLCSGCGLFMLVLMAEQQQQQRQQQQQVQQPPPPAPKDKEAGGGNGKADGAGNGGGVQAAPGNGQPANPAAAQQPQPEPEPEKHPEVLYGIAVVGLLTSMAYAAFSVVCFQSGRRAIHREIVRLIGDPNAHNHPHDPQY